VTEFACETGPADRAQLSAHLAESRRLLTAQLERMDMCYFRISADEARIVSPVTEACDAIAAAAGKPGRLRAQLPPLSRQDDFVVSGWLEDSRDRAAGRGWADNNDVATAVDRIRRAWDAAFNVTGDPGERAHLRTAAAWKPARGRQARYLREAM
jgi:hypothetical protein